MFSDEEIIEQVFDGLGTWNHLQETWFASPFTFSRDFGPWKAGACISWLAFEVPEMELVEYDTKGHRVTSCRINFALTEVPRPVPSRRLPSNLSRAWQERRALVRYCHVK